MKRLLLSFRRCYGLAAGLASAAVWAAVATSYAVHAVDTAANTATTTPATAKHLPTVCIIGGGIGGASAAHFLRGAAPSLKLLLFERRPHLGGRLASLWLPPVLFDSGSGIRAEGDQHVEAGGSIIHPRNEIMVHFVDDVLRLSRRDAPDQSMGLWDGRRFVLRLDAGRPVANVARLLWRYGLSLPRMQAAVRRLLASFDAIYGAGAGVPVVPVGFGGNGDGGGLNRSSDAGWGIWRVGVARLRDATRGLFGAFRTRPPPVSQPPTTVADLLSPRGDTSLVDLAARRLGAYAASAGLLPPLTAELVPAITRVNYGQEPEGMAALAGAVGLAGSGGGLWAVAGGNAQVPAGLIARAGATVHAAEVVTRVAELPPSCDGTASSYVLTSVPASADAVGAALATAASATRGGRPPSAVGTARDAGGPAVRFAPPLAPNGSRTTACDAVVVATPLELSGGLVVGDAAGAAATESPLPRPPPPPPPLPPARPFRACVATFVRAEVEPAYWGLPRDCCGCVPDAVLTTAAAPAGGVPFTSLSALSPRVRGQACATGPDRAVYKLFSPAPLTAADLGRLFRAHTVLAVVPWAAYPKYDPPPLLGSFLLGGLSGGGDSGSDGGGVGGGGGGTAGNAAPAAAAAAGRLVYVNAIESAASAMEMSALGGKTAAALVADALGLGSAQGEADRRHRPPAITPSPPPPSSSVKTEL